MRKRTLRAAMVTVAAVAAVGTVPMAWGAVTGSDGSGDAGKKSAAGESADVVDFNQDGYADVVSASPRSSVDGVDGAGYVTVSYGTADGVDPARTHILHMGEGDIPGVPTKGARFGTRPVTGDLDGDGYTDLAVKISKKDDGDDAGGVIALWGSDEGLTGGTYLEDLPDGEVGRDLTAGDFDGDGATDLVVRTGTEGGLLKGPFTRDGKPAEVADVPGTDRSETILDVVAGDITGDGIDDLFTFNAFQNNGEAGDFYRGTKDGLAKPDPERALPSGATGAVGDVDGDGFGDLVMRSYPNGDAEYDDGQLSVVYGGENGPTDRVEVIDQDSPGVPGVKEEDDLFGQALDVADVNGDGYADVVAGAPGEGAYGREEGGAVVVLHGGPEGLGEPNGQAFDQNAVIEDAFEAYDRFGSAVRLLDVNGDGAPDLVAGAPGEDEEAGGLWWLPGSSDGITAEGARTCGLIDLGAESDLRRLGDTFAR